MTPTKERQRKHRESRKAAGMIRVEFWVDRKDADAVRDFISGLRDGVDHAKKEGRRCSDTSRPMTSER